MDKKKELDKQKELLEQQRLQEEELERIRLEEFEKEQKKKLNAQLKSQSDNYQTNDKNQHNINEINKINKLSRYGVSVNNKVQSCTNQNINNNNNNNQEIIPSIINKNDELKAPIICVIGHVDAGKTTLLDKLRGTCIQKNEVGGITQQINASWIPIEQLLDIILKMNTKKKYDITIPGLLFIDTPGHETFINMRSRGTSMCNLVILVINIMKGIQDQTLESIKLLQLNNIPFMIVLNKIDKIYKWVSYNGESFLNSIKKQTKNVSTEFTNMLNNIMFELGKLDINSKLYYEIKNLNEAVPIIPISATTNEGIPDLLVLLTQYAQKKLKNNIIFNDNFEGSIVEINQLEGYGSIINILVINGTIKKGDIIAVNSMNGILHKTIKFLLVKNNKNAQEYIHHDIIKATNYISIAVTDNDNMDKIIPGSPLYILTDQNTEIITNKLLDD